MAKSDKIHIIGIGDDGVDSLTSTARRLIEGADLLIGAALTLALVPPGKAARMAAGGNLDAVVQKIATATGHVVVLASGDPLFYGVARYLCDRLGKDRFEVLPHVSSMQLAFARVKESWEEAYLTNLASHSLENVLERIRTAEKVGLFPSEDAPPRSIARGELLDAKIDYFSAYVCENLGSPDERVTQGELVELADQEFSPLAVMILVRKPLVPDRPSDAAGRRLFGNPDEAFLQSRPKQGLLTPAEVRAMALAQMDLGPKSIVWDVGAGSGSVAIEAAQVARDGKVYAIEVDPEDHQLIRANAERFGVNNLVGVLGRAPEAWTDLPDPDCIFVGGTGREISRMVELAFARLKSGGRLVANVGSIESLSAVHEVLRREIPDAKIWMINIARGVYQLERVRFEALNPTFLIAVVKGEG